MLSEEIKVKLAADLPRDVVRRLPGGNGADYVPSHHVIERLNAVCGHDGWSIDYGVPQVREGARLVVHVPATLTVFGGTRRADVGVGIAANDKPDAIETAIKAAYTDGLKRCARTLGPSFGLALYDKSRATVGYSTTALALLDELALADDLTAWWKGAQGAFAKLDADEKDVVKGAVAGRRVELAAASAAVDPPAVPAVVSQPEPRQLAAPANDVAPARRELEARLARVRSVDSLVASVLATVLTEADRATVRPVIAAAAERIGVASEVVRQRLDAGRKLQLAAQQWGVTAEVLVDLEAADGLPALDAARRRQAPRVSGLAAPLMDTIKRRSAEIRNGLGAPGAIANALVAEAEAATSMEALRGIHTRLEAAAQSGTITAADAQRVTDALNDRGERLSMQDAAE